MRRGTAARHLAGIVIFSGFLSACTTTDDGAVGAASVGSGIAIGALTSNPIVGVAVGLAVQIAAGETIHFIHRARRKTIHSAIASAAGVAEIGELVPWSAASDIPPGDAFGVVEVVRAFGRHIPCREIVFTVTDFPGRAAERHQGEHSDDPYVKASLPKPTPPEPDKQFFVATICEDETGWQWASADPATERWGGLQ